MRGEQKHHTLEIMKLGCSMYEILSLTVIVQCFSFVNTPKSKIKLI